MTPYCRLDDLFFSALNWQIIHTRLYWDSFLTEMWHRDLSFDKNAVPPVGFPAWRSFVFRCSISKIFTPDFTVIHTSLECTWYLYIIGFYALIISLTYYCSIRPLLSLRARDRRLAAFSSLVVPWVVITTTCGAIGGGGVVGLMTSCFRCGLAWYLHSYTVTYHCNVHASVMNTWNMNNEILYDKLWVEITQHYKYRSHILCVYMHIYT